MTILSVKLNTLRGDNIDVNGIKVAIFDFDQTLAMHKDKDYPIHHCRLDEILFVDDKKEVIEIMNANGVKAILVDDV